jgi:hypothetical protein
MPTRVPVPTNRVIAAKLPARLIERLRSEARQHDRTLSGQVRKILREWAESAEGSDAR